MKMKSVLLTAAAGALVAAVPANAAVVDFEGYGAVDLAFNPGTISYQGLDFTGNTGFAYVWDGGSPNSNGSNNLILGFSPSDSIVITKTGGGLFNLSSLDLAISWYSGSSNANVLVNGNPLGITNSLTNYSLGLNNVSSVTITGLDTSDGYWTADNIVYSAAAVPEPSTWAMMLVGFGMVGFGLRSRRKQSVRVAYA